MRITAMPIEKWMSVSLGIAALLILCGCTGNDVLPRVPLCQIVVESGEYYSVFGCVKTVERGGDLSFRVQLTNNNLVESTDYADFTIENEGVSSVNGVNYQMITLHNVRYSTVVSLFTYQPYLIRYHANGGVQTNGDSGELVEVSASLSHQRLNTALGTDLFLRPGYTQTEWNTRSDGSGTAVGQGSRIDPSEEMELYAQWSPWTDGERFTYFVTDGAAVITGYDGHDEVLTVPAQLDGYPVKAIEAGAFAEAHCEGLVLPSGLKRIADGAFSNAKIREVWLYDDLTEVSDDSFANCPIETVHINAARPPVYSGTYFDTFPDKMDWLRSLAGQRKLVLAGGSSVRFGFDSGRLDEAFPEYVVADMGVFAYTNALPQYELILRHMEPGDSLLSTPEFDAIKEQFCASNRLGYEFYAMLEGNYDLFSELNCTHYTGIWDAFEQYQQAREGMPFKSYAENAKNYDEDGNLLTGLESYNQYGDYILPRPNQAEDKAFGIKLADYDPASFPSEILDALNGVYRLFQEKGISVYFSYAPRSLRAVTQESTPGARAELDALLREKLCAPVISAIEDSMFPGYYFYETDNHLSDEGVRIRTEQVIAGLRQVFVNQTGKEGMP